MTHRPLRLVLAAALAVTVAACDGGDPEAESLAAETFTLRVGGGETQTFRGSAFFSSGTTEGGDVFGLVLGSPEGVAGAAAGGRYLTFVRFGAAPSSGVYGFVDLLGEPLEDEPLDTDQFVGLYIDLSESDPENDIFSFGGWYLVRSGTLTFDHVDTDGAVVGSFEGSAQRFEFADVEDPEAEMFRPVGEPVTVEGAFNASFRDGLFDDGSAYETPPFARLAQAAGE